MRLRRMGLEWGAAYDAAQPLLITSEFWQGTQILVYELEGGGLCVEIPLSAQLNVRETTLTEHENRGKGEQVLEIRVEDSFDYVPKKRELK